MTTTVLKHASDAHASQLSPARNYADAVRLRLCNLTNEQRIAYVFFGGGPRPGVFVVSAKLRLWTRGEWTGTPTLTVKRVTSKWGEGTLTWRNQPTVTTSSQATAAPGELDDGTMVEFDVTNMVRTAFLGTGAPFYGFQITTTGSTVRNFHSAEAEDNDVRPRLEITYTDEPSQPVDLVPGDGSVVSVAQPVLAWRSFDIDGDDQLALRVQIDAAGNFTSGVDFDSGWITSSDTELDLATTGYAGLAVNASTSWRVQTQDDTGQQSAWSEVAEITRIAKPTLTINAPTSQVEEPTPEIITTLDGQPQEAIMYRIEEQQPDGEWLVTWEKKRFSATAADGATYEFEVPTADETPVHPGITRNFASGRSILPRPPIRRKDRTYRLTVRAWDTIEGRIATPGDPHYVEESVEFMWVDADTAPTSPGPLTAVQEPGDGPGIVFTWTRAAVPDYWALMVDGILVRDKVPAVDWQVGFEQYSMTYYGADPNVPHTYEIIAEESL